MQAAGGNRRSSQKRPRPAASASGPTRSGGGGEKRAPQGAAAASGGRKQHGLRRNEDIKLEGDGDEEGYFSAGSDDGAPALEEERSALAEEANSETADERRLRLAKEYLARLAEASRGSVRGDDEGESSDADSQRGGATFGAVSAKLQEDALAARGVLYRAVGSSIAAGSSSGSSLSSSFVEGHRLSPTCIAVSADGRVMYTGSKDCTIIRWERGSPRAGSLASSSSSSESAASSEWSQLLYPGRRRTRADKATQEQGGHTRPVLVAGYGGGRIGSTTTAAGVEDGGTSSGGGDALSSRGEGALPGAAAAVSKLLAPKVIQGDGQSMIIVPVAPRGPAAGAGGDRLASAIAANSAAVASLRQVPDYGIAGHTAEILAIALSPDEAFLVSGGRDRYVRVWDPAAPISTENFVGHKDAVTGLTFRCSPAASAAAVMARAAGRAGGSGGGSSSAPSIAHALYSSSADRSVKLWSLDEMAYVETLFGHQAEVCALASAPGGSERCVTVGRDRSARLWKIPEQTQLVFRGHASDGNEESVIMVGDSWFVSGAQDGSLSLWHVSRKKPVATVMGAHGDGSCAPPPAAPENASAPASSAHAGPGAGAARSLAGLSASTGCDEEALTSAGYCNAVTSLAYLPNSDVFASGSGDGFVRIWALEEDGPSRGGSAPAGQGRRGVNFRSMRQVGAVPLPGIVNGLAFSANGAILAAAVGQEHRMGRWWRYSRARNGVAVVQLPEGGGTRGPSSR